LPRAVKWAHEGRGQYDTHNPKKTNPPTMSLGDRDGFGWRAGVSTGIKGNKTARNGYRGKKGFSAASDMKKLAIGKSNGGIMDWSGPKKGLRLGFTGGGGY